MCPSHVPPRSVRDKAAAHLRRIQCSMTAGGLSYVGPPVVVSAAAGGSPPAGPGGPARRRAARMAPGGAADTVTTSDHGVPSLGYARRAAESGSGCSTPLCMAAAGPVRSRPRFSRDGGPCGWLGVPVVRVLRPSTASGSCKSARLVTMPPSVTDKSLNLPLSARQCVSSSSSLAPGRPEQWHGRDGPAANWDARSG